MQPQPVELTKPELRSALASLPGWSLDNDEKLAKDLTFKSFREAVGFMVQVFLIAENMNHHPDIRNQFHSIEIRLMTERIGAVSSLDIELAKQIDSVLSGRPT
jgi:4a-hydroxytetrahydrobiopterin dehydratase